VSLTLGEASEIERRNEAVRDRVINRECAGEGRPAQCGGTVHAAAIALLEDTQRDSKAKLEALRRLTADGTNRVVVLITAGLPFRHEPPELRQLVSDFRDHRVRLILVRLEASTQFRGVLSDAAEKLASRLKDVATVTLRDDQDIIRVAQLISPTVEATPSAAEKSARAPHREATGVLKLLRAYVARFAHEMKFVIAHEHYEQQVRSRAGSFGATAGMVVASRSTEAEVAFAHITDGMWIMTRQVTTVDGRPVAAPPAPPFSDVRTEGEAVERMKQFANDAARWNIGKVRRNINTPTLVMWFLSDPVVERFRLSVAGTEHTPTGLCHVVRFKDVSDPPLMEVEHGRAPASGRVWVLGDSGAIVKTEMVLEQTEPSFRGAIPVSRAIITVDYVYWPLTKFWVPATMVERYEQPATRESETVLSKAIYSKYEQFTVGVRIK
jgi:hypothetical protein